MADLTDERLPDPEFFRGGALRLATRMLAPGDIRANAGQVAAMRAFTQVEDPQADAVVRMMLRMPKGEGRALFERALAEGIDAIDSPPAELRDFFATVEATPYWVDQVRLDRGARAVTRAGLLGLFPLGDMALMGGYLASKATKPLVSTGAIAEKSGKRLVETAHWWIDVTTPGAMRPGAPGYVAALRVRLVHAHVRAAMNRRDDWDYAAWDRPVNQVQTAGTLLLFSLVYIFGSQLLGIRYSARERADILHLWRYIGWLMGLSEELLPADEADAWRLMWLIASLEFTPDEDSKLLARAMMDSHEQFGAGFGPLRKVVSHGWGRLHSSISRLVLGKEHADFLGLPHDPAMQSLIIAGALANFAAETVRRRVPGATALQERLGIAGRRFYLARTGKIFKLDRTGGSPVRAVA